MKERKKEMGERRWEKKLNTESRPLTAYQNKKAEQDE